MHPQLSLFQRVPLVPLFVDDELAPLRRRPSFHENDRDSLWLQALPEYTGGNVSAHKRAYTIEHIICLALIVPVAAVVEFGLDRARTVDKYTDVRPNSLVVHDIAESVDCSLEKSRP